MGDEYMAKVIMLIGIQGSGKTTYSKVLKEKYDARVISSDKIRQTFIGIEEKDVFPTVYKLCSKELRSGYNVIIDATKMNSIPKGELSQELRDIINSETVNNNNQQKEKEVVEVTESYVSSSPDFVPNQQNRNFRNNRKNNKNKKK